MIAVQPFNIGVIDTHRCFYLLKNISNIDELQLIHETPGGFVEVDFVDVFKMNNNSIVVAWKKPLELAPMHNLLAISGSTVEVVNTATLERVIDIYDRPVDAQVGTFIFVNSDMLLDPNIDWRCDNGKFGPAPFQSVGRVIEQLSDISVYEPVLSVNGVGHLIYIEGVAKQGLANDFLSTGTMPTVGRTLWETLKLVREWAIVNQPPFNNQEAVSHKANLFIKNLGFTEQELSVIDNQIPMQISNYLMGDTNARQRPSGILPITDDIKNMLFKRMSSGILSALEYLSPGMWNIEELLSAEKIKLAADLQRLENMQLIPGAESPYNQSVWAMRQRFFDNKQLIIDKVENNAL